MEIIGLGTDIEQVGRFVRITDDAARMSRLFGDSEKAYILSRPNPAQTACGMYCAKEAAAKALGCGLAALRPLSVTVTHDASGAPHLSAAQAQGTGFFVSISHSGDYATATVLAVKE